MTNQLVERSSSWLEECLSSQLVKPAGWMLAVSNMFDNSSTSSSSQLDECAIQACSFSVWTGY